MGKASITLIMKLANVLFDIGVKIGKLNKTKTTSLCSIFNFQFVIKQFKKQQQFIIRGKFSNTKLK